MGLNCINIDDRTNGDSKATMDIQKQLKPLIVITAICVVVICSYFIYGKQVTIYMPETQFYNPKLQVPGSDIKDGQHNIRTNIKTAPSLSSSSSTVFVLPFAGNYSSVGVISNIDQNYSAVQTDRVKRIRQTCKDTPFLSKNIYRGHNKPRIYHSKQYNFAYCKVPKSGSTFWTQAFAVLSKGTSVANKTFTKARSKVHGKTRNYQIPVANVHQLPVVVVSRDPFSRLYSAYVDKVYLLLEPKLSKAVLQSVRNISKGKGIGKCALNTSFQDFLKFIIKKVHSGKILDRHWAPIMSLCRPCEFNAKYLVKQESFATDVEFILKDVGVEEDKLNVIVSALHEHRVEFTIPGIIETAYKKTKGIRSCLTAKGLAKRLYRSFQIQGYISENITFPKSKFPTELKYRDSQFVTKIFMEIINANKMTSDDAKEQRQKALVDAYETVDKNVIEQIREIYQMDIAIFDYGDSSLF